MSGILSCLAEHSRTFLRRLIGAEISSLARYCDQVIQWFPLPYDRRELLQLVDCKAKQIWTKPTPPDLKGSAAERSLVLLHGTVNHHPDIQELFRQIKQGLARTSRLVLVAYSPYWEWLYRLANRLGLRQGEPPHTFLTRKDLRDLIRLTGFELVRIRPVGFIPCPGTGWLNRLLVACPLINNLSLVHVITLRPIIPETGRPSLTILAPARNERDNIEPLLKRIPESLRARARLEVVFVEGHSRDGTWEEIVRVQKRNSDGLEIQAVRQAGVGKGDAVRCGLEAASGDVVAILDADLTMPPEMLPRFYEAYCQGAADFVNGSRLLYPMEDQAMRFLNRLGNVFFAKTLSWILGTNLSDTLCGTKLFLRQDYERMTAWRQDFGDVDPFGDFEILYPAAVLGLGIVNLPVQYRARTYGKTNISRFAHGWMLAKMTLRGLWKFKLGPKPGAVVGGRFEEEDG